MNGLRIPRTVALWAIAFLVTASALVSFMESYRALWIWADTHELTGLWADVWPLQVDVFIAVGEIALFVALADGWSVRSRSAAWTVTAVGLVESVAGNVGHVSHIAASGDLLLSRATAAVPPLAAAASLAVGLGVLKRVVENSRSQARSQAQAGAGAGAGTALLNGHSEPVPTDMRDAVVDADDMSDEDFTAHMQLRHPGTAISREAHDAEEHADGIDHVHVMQAVPYPVQ